MLGEDFCLSWKKNIIKECLLIHFLTIIVLQHIKAIPLFCWSCVMLFTSFAAWTGSAWVEKEQKQYHFKCVFTLILHVNSGCCRGSVVCLFFFFIYIEAPPCSRPVKVIFWIVTHTFVNFQNRMVVGIFVFSQNPVALGNSFENLKHFRVAVKMRSD